MSDPIVIEPVTKIVELTRAPSDAFDLFVDRMDQWWPLDTFAVSTDDAVAIRIDSRVGGTISEVTRAGVEHVWATITAFVQDERIEFTWHPGAPEVEATLIDVRFDATNQGTRVTLTHSRWEARGDGAQKIRDNYESGWDIVLAPFVAAASA